APPAGAPPAGAAANAPSAPRQQPQTRDLGPPVEVGAAPGSTSPRPPSNVGRQGQALPPLPDQRRAPSQSFFPTNPAPAPQRNNNSQFY
ncbi:MAG: hypothetical protein JWN93_1139, partial [Hyphomicrobiales bacterium]|nr:hypothetical protein [Hyphomicrobiales bacterium]